MSKIKCENCNGTGVETNVYSCCGDDITGNDIDLCPTCKEHCSLEPEALCEDCGGTGLSCNDAKPIASLQYWWDLQIVQCKELEEKIKERLKQLERNER